MSGARSNQRLMWACTLACALVLVADRTTAAEQKPAAPSQPGSAQNGRAGESISAAKKEFEGLKSARNPALQPGGEMPRVKMPEMPPSSPGIGPLLAPKSEGTEKKSANWLVDAMEKQKSRKDSDRDRRSLEAERKGRVGLADAAEEASERDQRREPTQSEIEERKRVAAETNPMTRFLGEWMTPQDYSLLKPTFDPASALGAAGSGAPAGGIGAGLGSFAGPDPLGSAGLASVRTPLPASVAPRENPYLSGLTVPPVAIPQPPAPLISPVPAPPATAIAPLPPAPGPKSQVPDFAKPAQDEKYFKQLKRF